MDEIVTVRSFSADFEKDEWIVRPVAPGARIGGGVYLMVPVDPMETVRLRCAIERLRDELANSDAHSANPTQEKT